ARPPVASRSRTHKRRGVSLRRACALLGVARSGLGYESKRAKADAPVLARMREIAALHPRYGYRFVRIFLEREGHHMSADRACRRSAREACERAWRASLPSLRQRSGVHVEGRDAMGDRRRNRYRLHRSGKALAHNGTDESFNGSFRDECLSLEWFRCRTDAVV